MCRLLVFPLEPVNNFLPPGGKSADMNFFLTKFAATKSLGKSALSFARLQQMTKTENVSFSDGLRDCEDPECCENKDCQSNQVGSKDGNNWESESLSQKNKKVIVLPLVGSNSVYK